MKPYNNSHSILSGPAIAGPLFVHEKMDQDLLDGNQHNPDWQEQYLRLFAAALNRVFDAASHRAAPWPQVRRLPAAAGTLDREYEIIEDSGENEDPWRVEDPQKPRYQSLAMQVQAPLESACATDPEAVKSSGALKQDTKPVCQYQRPNAFGQDSYTAGSLIVRQGSEGFEVKDTGQGKTYRVQRINGRWIGPCNCGLDAGPPPSYQCPHQIAVRGLLFNRWWFGKPYPRRFRGCR